MFPDMKLNMLPENKGSSSNDKSTDKRLSNDKSPDKEIDLVPWDEFWRSALNPFKGKSPSPLSEKSTVPLEDPFAKTPPMVNSIIVDKIPLANTNESSISTDILRNSSTDS